MLTSSTHETREVSVAASVALPPSVRQTVIAVRLDGDAGDF
jgi:hypothetical protein